jgi:transcriptional regulator with XRE-family HTH domain
MVADGAPGGLTHAELAQRAGIGRPHLNHIEVGRKNPTVVVLVHLARSLGVARCDLLLSYRPTPADLAAQPVGHADSTSGDPSGSVSRKLLWRGGCRLAVSQRARLRRLSASTERRSIGYLVRARRPPTNRSPAKALAIAVAHRGQQAACG